MKKLILVFVSAAVLVSCKQAPKGPSTEDISTLFPSDSLNALDSTRMDSMQLTTIKFDKEIYDFGEITEGEVIKREITYTNTGKHPLVIEQANGSCGCTVADFPKEPLAPGESAELEVEFNSKGRVGAHTKSVIIEANTIPPIKYVNFSVQVKEKKK